MNRMGVRMPGGFAAVVPALAAPLRAYLQFTAVVALLLACYFPTARAMSATWASSDTYAHGFVVLPASLWFAWRERFALAKAPRAPHWSGLILLVCAASLWLLGELANARAPSQWALVVMLPALVLALFGAAWLRVLAFPIALLAFAVPFGDALVPILTDWTADFTVAALLLTGVPVFREGNDFVIPSGHWSVVEACSGIRYLTASTFVGVLFAWTVYRRASRRIAFVVASILVPVVANWIRAYLIVLIGHLSDNQLATGVDHLIHGWIFFGLVIGLMFAVGARWREDDATAEASHAQPSGAGASGSWGLAAAALVLVVVAPMMREALLRPLNATPLRPLEMTVPGWHRVAEASDAWRPALSNPVRVDQLSFARGGSTVTMTVGWFQDQRPGSELITVANRLVPERGSPWRQAAAGYATALLNGAPVRFDAFTLRNGAERLRVWRVYWVGRDFEHGAVLAKLRNARDRLLRRDDSAAWMTFAIAAADEAAADHALAKFISEAGGQLRTALESVAE